MRKIFLLISSVLFVSQIMAQSSRYWVNGAGNWNDVNHWALTSGGEPGASFPDKTASVVFDNNSLSPKGSIVTINVPAECNNITVTSTGISFKGKAPITITGSVDIAVGTDFSKFKGDLVFASSGKVELAIPIELNSNMVFNGKNGSWNFNSDVKTKKDIILENGNVNTQNYSVETNSFIAKGKNNRGLQLGNSEVKVTNWDFTESINLDFDAGKSAITIPKSVEKSVKTGNLLYNVIIPANSGSKALSATITPVSTTCPNNSTVGIKDDGQIAVTVSGGSGSYVIRLYDAALNPIKTVSGVASYTFKKPEVAAGIKSGSYIIAYGEDVNNLSVQGTTVGPDNLAGSIVVNTHITCPDAPDLSLTINGTGGTGALSYAWTSQIYGYTHAGQTTPAELVIGDNYIATMTDANGCKLSDNFYYLPIGVSNNDYFVADGRPETISISNVTSVNSCQGLSTGSITVATVTGGTPNTGPYFYGVEVAGVPVYGGLGVNTISGLAVGNYNVWVKDGNGCEKEYATVVAVGETALPIPTFTAGAVTACVGTTGNVYSTEAGMSGYVWTVSAGGSITSGAGTNSIQVTWSAIGLQTVSISYTNAGGCTAASPTSRNVTVSAVPTPSFTSEVLSACAGSTGNVYTTEIGMSNYVWTLSAGSAVTLGGGINDNSVTVTWNTAGAQTVSINYNNGAGCAALTPTVSNVTVNARPTPTFTAEVTNTCVGSTGNVYSTQAGMSAYAWTVSAGGTITSGAGTNSIQVTWNTAGAQTVSVNYNNISGCNATTPTVSNVTVNALPVPTFVAIVTDACVGSTGNVYSTQPGMSAYIWTVSAGGSITSGAGTNSIQVTWNTVGAQTVSISYTSASGCVAASPTIRNVSVSAIPTPTFTAEVTTACEGSTGNVYTTEAGMVNYAWIVSGGGTITLGGGTSDNSVTVTWNTAGARTVSVNYDNIVGCSAASPIVSNVTVNARPTPTFTAEVTSACVGSTGNVYSTQAGMSAYTWIVSAGGTITSGAGTNSIQVTWNTAGSQTVSVNYNNVSGCAALSPAVSNVIVSALPTPTFTAGPIIACVGSTGNVYSTEAGMSGYLWTVSAGGAITSGAATNSIQVTWNTSGAKTVSINYTNASGCTAVSPTVRNVTVSALPIPTFTAEVNSACVGSTGNVYTTEAGMSVYVWTVSAGGSITSGAGTNSIQVTWNTAGAQTVSVNYNNGAGCTASSPTVSNVVVNIRPLPTFTSEVTSTCVGSTGNVYTTEGGMSGYVWTISAGGIITSGNGTNSIEVTWNTAGAQTVSVNYDNASGCDAATSTVSNVTVNALPVPTFTAGAISACIGSTGNVYTTEAGMSGYLWTVSAGGAIASGAGTNSIQVTWNTAGPQTVSISYTSVSGCVAASPTVRNVTVNSLPIPTFTSEVTSACAGSTGNVYTTEAGMSSYVWTVSAGGAITSGTGTNSIQVTWNTAGAQTVSVNYNNGAGCAASSPTVSNVTINALPIPTFIAEVTSTCAGSTGNVYTTEPGMSNYAWIVSAGGSITLGTGTNSIEVTWNTAGPQTVSVNYDNLDGCTATLPTVSNVTVTPAPTSFAGIDTTLCSDAISYAISDASASNPIGVSWVNSTTGFSDGFSDSFTQNPIYTFTTDDLGIDTLKLVMTVSEGICNDVTDTLLLIRAPELIASVGGRSPYSINVASTEINVAFSLNHIDISQLSFYLVAPDGSTELKLYSFNIITDGCNPLLINVPNTIDSLVFSLNSAGSSGTFNLCDFDGLGTISGEFDPTDSWNIFNGFDPAQGGWSVKIVDNFGGSTGFLTKARITFLDKNEQGNDQEITFYSGDINNAIVDNSSTTYTVPIGLRTNCYGACDAMAIVSVIGGKEPYSYDWSIPSTNDTVLLCGGTFDVTVTDARGCQSIATVDVLEPDPIVLTFTSTNIKCFGDSTGMVKVTATNGAGAPYTYLWDDGLHSTTAQVNSLPVGTYTVTVTDKNLCTKDSSITITQPALPLSVTYVVIPTNCNTNTGSITLTPAGGTRFTVGDPYKYTWSQYPLLVGNVANSLPVGNYQVTIKDTLGCELDTTISMIDNGDMDITGFTMNTPVSCNSACDGVIQVVFTGGNGSYTYNWSGPSLTGTAISLANVCGDSTYFITVTDDLTSCVADSSFVIPQPDSLKLQILSQTDVLCFGDSTGKAKVTGTGGTGDYSYIWYTPTNDTLSIIDTASNLPFGYTYIEVKDVKLCSHIDSIYIDQPTLLTATKDSTATSCGVATGSATITPAGGTAPYTYLWDDVLATTDSIAINLASGIYHVIVTDKNLCDLQESVTVIDNSTMLVVLDSIHNVQCAGSSDGQAFITVSGAVEPIKFEWSNDETTEDAQLMLAGTHFVTVTDFNLCSRVMEVTITQPDSLKTVQSVLNEPLCFGTNTGSAVVTPNGGVIPYTYLWDDADEQTDSIAINLFEGIYTVTVTDANGCDTTAMVTLTEPDSITFAFEFKQTNCGDSIGQINIANILGGTSPYTVDWASSDWNSNPLPDSIGTDTIRNLWVANYVAIVTDGNGCSVRDSMNMTDTSKMSIVLDSIAMVTCNGGNNGAILVHGINGKEQYTYLWDNVGADSDSLLNDVTAGIYSVKVTDAGQCQRDTAFTITEPSEIQNQWVFTDSIVCHGQTTASLYALIAGGVPPYEYEWVNSSDELKSKDSSLINVGPDWYYLTVTDNNGCMYDDSIQIFEPSELIVNINDFGPTNCTDSTGWAKVTIEDRLDQADHLYTYSYNWYLASEPSTFIEGQTTDSISKLWVDSYIVEVTDNLGCLDSDTIMIQDTSGLEFVIETISLPTCLSINNGVAAVHTIVNGTAPFDLVWKFGTDTIGTTDTTRVLPVGTTNVFVIDVMGCRAVKTVTMADDSVLAIKLSVNNNTNLMNCTGYAEISEIKGGVKPYSFIWTDEEGNILETEQSFISAKCEGLYYLTIKDALSLSSCHIDTSVFIKYDPLAWDTVTIKQVLCYGDSTGSVTITGVGGGFGNYVYEWAHQGWDHFPASDSVGASITNLEAGKYYFTVTDQGGSGEAIHDSIEITQNDNLIIVYDSTPSDCDAPTGFIAINEGLTSGGKQPYLYKWNNGEWLEDSLGIQITNIGADNYYVTVTDENGCVYLDSVVLPDNSEFAIDPQIISPARCNGSTAEICTNPNDKGFTPYEFSWSNGAQTDTTNVEAGTYTVTVTDVAGCKRYGELDISEPDSITFDYKIVDSILCYGYGRGSLQFTNVQGGNTNDSYQFKIDVGLEPYRPLQQNSSFSDLPVGQYTLVVRDDKGCVESKFFEFLSKSPQMIPDFEIVEKDSCNYFTEYGKMAVKVDIGYFDQPVNWEGEPITYLYQWDGNPQLFNDTLTQVSAGYHYVKVSDSFGCANTFDSIFMPALTNIYDTVFSFIHEEAFKTGNYYCPDDSVGLSASVWLNFEISPVQPESIIWEAWADGVNLYEEIGDTIYSDTNVGMAFIAMVTYNRCSAPDTLFVGRYQIDSLDATVGGDSTTIAEGKEIVLWANEPPVTYSDLFSTPDTVTHSYLWIPNNDMVTWVSEPKDSISPKVQLNYSTVFTVYDTITIYNSPYSVQVCILSDTVSIKVLSDVIPPKGFTPNGDGMFDKWDIPALLLYNNADIQIFDRWGGLVWEHSGAYEGNEWEGTNTKGKALPSGTYYYIIKYGDDTGTKTLTGPVTILR